MNKYVYLVRCRTQFVKVGYSEKMKIQQQINRYKTYYPSFRMLAYSHNQPKRFEHYLKWKLDDHKIAGELFDDFVFTDVVKLCEHECNLIYDREINPPKNVFLL